jgi:hypothetical protein
MYRRTPSFVFVEICQVTFFPNLPTAGFSPGGTDEIGTAARIGRPTRCGIDQ